MSLGLAPLPGVRVSLNELVALRHHIREFQLFSTASRRSPLIGLHHSRLRGRGVDFDQVRAYLPGDDVRSIDWRVTARTQEPHTKLYHEERERPVFILVEQSRRTFFGSGERLKSVLAAELASLIGWAALAHNDRVGGLVFSDREWHEIRPRRRKQSLLQFLNRLSHANQLLSSEHWSPGQEPFTIALRRSREVLRPGSLLFIICDERALGDQSEAQLSLLARHNDVVLMPLSDPLDHHLPQTGRLRFAQSGRELRLDTDLPSLQSGYGQLAEKRQQRWRNLAQRLAVPLLPLDTRQTGLQQLVQHLQPLSGRS